MDLLEKTVDQGLPSAGIYSLFYDLFLQNGTLPEYRDVSERQIYE